MRDDRDWQLALRLKTERELRGWSLAELAARSGVSKAMANRIERGECSPTASLLGKLSAAFGLTLSQLLARSERGRSMLAPRAAQPAWTDPETGFVRRTLTPEGGPPTPLELVWGELPPGAAIAYPAAAYAFTQDHQVVLLEGRLRFTQGTQMDELAPGDCLRLGPPADCIYENPGPDPCRYIVALIRG